jgi:steroid delta-isomerase-like uncharacterized protein
VTTQEQNKQIVREYVDAFNRGDFPRLREVFAEDALIYGVLGWGGIDAVEPVWKELHEAFAIQLNVEAMAAEGDTVAVRYRETGRSRAPFRGQPATDRPYEMVAMEWFEVKDGRITRRWGARDSATQARQMGHPLS